MGLLYIILGAFIVVFDEKSGAEKAYREIQDDMIIKVHRARVRELPFHAYNQAKQCDYSISCR